MVGIKEIRNPISIKPQGGITKCPEIQVLISKHSANPSFPPSIVMMPEIEVNLNLKIEVIKCI
jgi:hypothetical protein